MVHYNLATSLLTNVYISILVQWEKLFSTNKLKALPGFEVHNKSQTHFQDMVQISYYWSRCYKNISFRKQLNFIHWILYIYIYINYIIHYKIKGHNHQVPKTVRVPRNKTNPKKINLKFTKMQVTTINTECTDS